MAYLLGNWLRGDRCRWTAVRLPTYIKHVWYVTVDWSPGDGRRPATSCLATEGPGWYGPLRLSWKVLSQGLVAQGLGICKDWFYREWQFQRGAFKGNGFTWIFLKGGNTGTEYPLKLHFQIPSGFFLSNDNFSRCQYFDLWLLHTQNWLDRLNKRQDFLGDFRCKFPNIFYL